MNADTLTFPASGGREPPELNNLFALRTAIRAGTWTGPTAGLAPGFVQANVVLLPQTFAAAFADFCAANPRPCPLVAQTEPGNPEPFTVAPGADLRTDVPRYRVFQHGEALPAQPTDIKNLWQPDTVGFLIGCSFTFESALLAAGVPLRHIELGCNVPMYRTNRPCVSAGPFAGPLVVSMRPIPLHLVSLAHEITSRYPAMHGAPVHLGDPAALGIADLSQPDFGDAVPVASDEIPVFWACGVTPQLALLAARPPWAITHSPGCMFITDLHDHPFATPAPAAVPSRKSDL